MYDYELLNFLRWVLIGVVISVIIGSVIARIIDWMSFEKDDYLRDVNYTQTSRESTRDLEERGMI